MHALGPASPAVGRPPRSPSCAVHPRGLRPLDLESGGVMPTLALRVAARAHMPAVTNLPHLRESAIATWRGRMINEHSSARVFDGLANQFANAGVHDVVDE